MRWQRERPQVGDTRVRTGFLWRPLEIAGESRWLETVSWREEYRRVLTHRYWTATEWLD